MSAHGHAHHGHKAHSHAPANERALAWAFFLTAGFMVVELAGGLLSGSLALIADAGHMLTDAAALALAWLGFRIGRRPADALRSYGYARFEVLAGFLNALTLLAIVVWIAIEAAMRFYQPVPVLAGPMLAVAVVGLCVNLLVLRILRSGDRDHVNIRGALLHVLGDLFGSAGAIVAAGVIYLTGWTPIDPLVSLLVALLILRSGWALLRRSGHILLEGMPEGLSEQEIKASIAAAVPGVRDVHHLHVWSLSSGRALATLHVRLDGDAEHPTVLARVKAHLKERFGIAHSTVQIDPEGCPDDHHHAGSAEHDHEHRASRRVC
jgi:cobalt-zinc-cadmium efflux system protein